jgi:hypothetical protein
MVQLEKYRGTRTRHTCPACNRKNEFTRFIDTDTGEYLPDNVGICNRSSKCGYRYTSGQYYADNPTPRAGQSAGTKKRGTPTYGFVVKNGSKVEYKTSAPTATPDYIAPEHLKSTLGSYERNAFVQFLFDLFPECRVEVESVLRMYLVGTYEDYCCFPSLDQQNRVCRAKLIRFNRENGKRLKGKGGTSSLPAKLKLKEDFQYKQIFFGEHLVPKNPDKTIAIVEAEKTAIIASICFPEFVWLGSNSKTWLKVERLQRLENRQVILYPDADGFDLWQSIATDARRLGLTVKASRLVEDFATDEQRDGGYDLADYLINQQSEINELNEVYDAYNSRVDLVLNDETLFNEFNLILDEQKAISIYNGESESEAERICTRSENVRAVALSV